MMRLIKISKGHPLPTFEQVVEYVTTYLNGDRVWARLHASGWTRVHESVRVSEDGERVIIDLVGQVPRRIEVTLAPSEHGLHVNITASGTDINCIADEICMAICQRFIGRFRELEPGEVQ